MDQETLRNSNSTFLPFLVRHDFAAFLTFVKFLTQRDCGQTGLLCWVYSGWYRTHPQRIEYSVASTALSQGRFLQDSQTNLCKTKFHYVLQRCFSFSLSLSCIPSGDAIMVFTVIEINLLFSPRSFVDNDVGLLGRQYNGLVVVNHCLEYVDFRYPTETLVDKAPLKQLLSEYTLAEMNLIQDLSLVEKYQSLERYICFIE